jgi:uroporphyrinogen decarboxylase
MVDMLRARGVRWFVVRTYGNPTALLPVWLESGINVLWCFEGAVGGVDYCALRKRHGRHLRLIGGIDLRAIEAGPSAIEAALLRTVPGLLEDGGYVPMSDGRVRANMPWAHYRYYRTRLQQIATFHSDQGGMP